MILSTPRVSRAMAQFREVISSPSGSFTQLAKLHGLFLAKRHLSSAAERDRMEFDMVIVGAGPAGLSAAIRAKQLAKQRGADVSVCVVEKGAQVGAHTLSGNVFEPRALDELLPNWRELNAPITVPVTLDTFSFLTEGRSIRLPTPPQMHNKGNYVVSLSEVVRWLGSQAEEMGVEVYPGFAASEVLFREDGAVCGVATTDTGIGKNGKPRPNFARGVELRGTVSLLAEGCRGSLSESIIERFSLREKAGAQHQTYGLGIKEVWEVRPEKHSPGTVLHTVGWPLPPDTYGGSFLYHMADNKVALGLVVGLDYKNPYLNPYQEFQRWKTHPSIRPLLEGGTCLQYGARTLNEGGLQSIPALTFPGGALIGCSAGFLNVPKIKGTHTAMKSGMLAAEAAVAAIIGDPSRTATTEKAECPSAAADLCSYESALRRSWVWQELRQVRNIRPAFHRFGGLLGGVAYSAIDTYLLRGKAPWTLKHGPPDHECIEPASKHAPIAYPKPDGQVAFDILTSVFRSGTNHEHDQPAHLKLRDPAVPSAVNWPLYAGPESRFCPAKVYEYIPSLDGPNKMELVINAQNCVHCKACSIKDPKQNICWTVPEGGGGPSYTCM
eukprot:jgi/Mesvir1/24627/Mv21936-RA.1